MGYYATDPVAGLTRREQNFEDTIIRLERRLAVFTDIQDNDGLALAVKTLIENCPHTMSDIFIAKTMREAIREVTGE